MACGGSWSPVRGVASSSQLDQDWSNPNSTNDANGASGEAELALARAVLSLLLFTHDATRVHGMFADRSKKRVAMLGLMLESNSFSPVTQKDDFLDRLYVAGGEFLEELQKTESKLPTELRAFYAAMNSRIDWAPQPILIGLVEAAGPADHVFYSEVLADMRARLEEAMPLDAVYICNHGAMITTENRDPDGEIFAMVREIVGPDTPIVARSICTATSRSAWSTTPT